METDDSEYGVGDDGVKYDNGKLRYDLIPVEALESIIKVYTMGAEKYADRNWEKGMSWGRVFGAVMRHAWAFWRGEEFDQESGLPHMAHAGWGCLALLHYAKYNKDKDDRSLYDVPTEKGDTV